MTDCKFKVGEIYKSRCGQEYRCVVIVPDANAVCHALFLNLHSGYVTGRYADGRSAAGTVTSIDILPNKRKEWVVTYKLNGAESVSVFVSEHGANNTLETWRAVNRFNQAKGSPPPYTEMRGPMLWESED